MLTPTINITSGTVHVSGGAVYFPSVSPSNPVAAFDRAPDGTLMSVITPLSGPTGATIVDGTASIDPQLGSGASVDQGRSYMFVYNAGNATWWLAGQV